MTTTAHTAEWLAEQPHPFVKLALTDLDGVLRSKYLSRAKAIDALEQGLGFCNVVFGWDIQDRPYDHAVDPGFADAHARIVPGSQRSLPWEDGLPFLLADLRDDGGPTAAACPRSLLAGVVDKATAMGFTARFGPEYEWFAYREDPASAAEKDYRDLRPLSPGMFGYSGLRTGQRSELMHDLYAQTAACGIELEGLHTETGPGALEAAIVHDEALAAADKAIIFKEAVKQIGYRHSLLMSFMAKPSAELPGCGGHLHQSLWRDGRNAFHDAADPRGMSTTMRQYLAGQLHFLPGLMTCYAPGVNSYKRYVPGSWAATRANWGIDNRTVAIRALPAGPYGTRLELRVPGADANPYIAIAAALASGLYGIEHGLELELPPVEGSAYAQQIGASLPADLGGAAGAMRVGKVAVLGQGFTEHFLKSREWEWQQYRRAVTDWERRRYFELS